MSNKKNEDIEMRGGDDFGGEKDPFLGRASPATLRVRQEPGLLDKLDHSPGASILAYCLASISMTVVNKYVVSGSEWNLNFFYLAIQSAVCTLAILAFKQTGILKNLAPFDSTKAKRWFPISLLLVGMIYTGAKALQFLSVPVYTIFKNLTIIVIAYGEVLWFGGSVTPITLLSFGLMVLSSVVAAWADIQAAIDGVGISPDKQDALSTLNAGYAWMGINVICTSAYVLGMRKVIKKMNFKDYDSKFLARLRRSKYSRLTPNSHVLQQPPYHPRLGCLLPATKNKLMIGMVYSGLAAIFISYCSSWCIRITSSTTYSMVGALNKLPIAVSGLIFFDAPVTFGSVTAIFLGFVSGLVFAWAKVRQKAQEALSLPTTNMSASAKSNRDAANS
ncbi:GDP-mannose transporter into the lumen of the Golgi [Podospora pseudocomata]|uniref:GDP-mannose transporter n=1 Tax=Podospora pseudocomata TaxID=2093779 RepID=A0ABR0G303_9PEZI|nr:GDP-mannose transporter into the lumen of the Golgi [Podospora pseudocomata]